MRFMLGSIAAGGGTGVLIGVWGAWLFVLAPERYLSQELHWLGARAVLHWTMWALGIGVSAGVAGGLPLLAFRTEATPPAPGRWVLAGGLAASVPVGLAGALLGWPAIDELGARIGGPLAGWGMLLLTSALAASFLVLLARRMRTAAYLGSLLASMVLLGNLGARFLGPRPEGPNLILISIDTLRADRLGCYGYGRARTPNIDALAQAGTLYETVIASAPVTLPAMSTLMTGADPPQHGAHYNGFYELDREALTLAEILANRGYSTGAVIGNFALDRRFGIHQGFDSFDDRMTQRMSPGPITPSNKREQATWWQEYRRTQPAQRFADEITDEGLDWLDRAAREPFMLWLHFMDPHGPFLPPPEYRGQDPYDGEVAFVDAQIGRFLSGYHERFPDRDTLVVVVADHGESLGEHGVKGHVANVYEQTLRVPFFMRRPGRVAAGLRVGRPLRGRDVRAEILRGLDSDAAGMGSLDEPASAPEDWWAYSETYQPVISKRGGVLRSLRGPRWKLVHQEHGRSVLIDLMNDPGESKNLADEYPERTKELLSLLQRTAGETAAASLEVDAESFRRLRDLGYVE